MEELKEELIVEQKDKKSKKKIIIGVLLFFLVIAILILIYYLFIYKIVKIEKFTKEDRVLVNSEYVEPDFSICYGTILNCKSLKIKKEGSVDTTVLGEYNINYLYKVDGKEKKLKKVIYVYDDVKPEISVISDLAFCRNGNLASGEYKALDNYDGDLTSEVKLSIEGDKSYLEVSDSSGNKETIEITALEFTSEPTISLNGESTVYVVVGNAYKESGYSASDTCDGDITDKVEIDGSVNTSVAGTYTLTYKVTNSANLSASVVRKVIVININQTIYPGDKKIYLTFDDGPGPYTSRLLDILDKYNVKATFFVTNQFGSQIYQNLIGEEARRGHTVAIHSYTHNFNIYSSVDNYFNDLNNMNNIIANQTGSKSHYVRFPGGSSNTVSYKYSRGIMTTLAGELTNRGYIYYDWNLDSCDSNSAHTSDAVRSCTINQLRGGTYMILMHDIKSYTVDAVDSIIPYALENGYSFLPITDTTPTYHQKISN